MTKPKEDIEKVELDPKPKGEAQVLGGGQIRQMESEG